MVRNGRFVLVAAALSLVGTAFHASADDKFPKSPTKKPSPNMTVRLMALGVLETCGPVMASHNGNPALATDEEYYAYISGRDGVAAKDPSVLVFDASLANSRDRTPSKMFPLCTKYFNDYASGVNAANAPLSPTCEARVKPFLKMATERLADYKKDGPKQGKVSRSRSMLESARFGMLKQGGGPIGHCAINDKFKNAFAPLKAQLATLEAQVVAEETAKGVKFVPVDNKDLGVAVSYLDLKTNQPAVGEQ